MADEFKSIEPFSNTPQPPTIYYAKASIVMAHFSESDIDKLGDGHTSTYIAFFGICVGVLATLIAVLLGADVADPKKYAATVALIFCSFVGSVVFGILTTQEYKKSNRTRSELKKRFKHD